MSDLFEEWLRLAEQDLRAAELLTKENSLSNVVLFN